MRSLNSPLYSNRHAERATKHPPMRSRVVNAYRTRVSYLRPEIVYTEHALTRKGILRHAQDTMYMSLNRASQPINQLHRQRLISPAPRLRIVIVRVYNIEIRQRPESVLYPAINPKIPALTVILNDRIKKQRF
jgi:hypothetical protein